MCVIGVGGHAEEQKNTAGLATSAPVCPCEGAEEEKGWGNGGLGSEGCHLMLTTDQSEGPRLSRTVEERGAGSSEADPAGQLSLARRHRRRISKSHLRSCGQTTHT